MGNNKLYYDLKSELFNILSKVGAVPNSKLNMVFNDTAQTLDIHIQIPHDKEDEENAKPKD